jgi:hypothetical protein
MASNLGEYAAKSARIENMPKNEFEHAEGLLHSEYEEDAEFLRASQIVDKYMQLCNVSNDKLLRLIQKDAQYLTHYRYIAEREPELRPFFVNLVHGWRNEILVTKMHKGKERDMQGSVDKGFTPQGTPYGFGEDFPKQEEEQNIFKRLLPKRRQQ